MTLVHLDIDPDAVRNNAEYLMYALGRTAEDVATELMCAGVKGEPENPNWCPIARYLLDRDARLTGVAVGSDAVHLETPGGTVCATVPEPVSTFIGLFDIGEYPGLIGSCLPNPLECPGTMNGTEDRP
ncbi:hypothetical protein GCM10010112_43750 [Actinoplanes lobatus]|uniref:Uncharacterized protein n=1 Tax=Actinoplanes lobatus TaxID=113568 RepID=A0A7W7MET7_9ACTN|nr:hypothetical protein [Actinoplanes lobatus]MBB4747586.1 hypothetical protein [Actinoplanes lobatus]GGN74026.1 hypothetical protein GCM10010112_43750 [Actinoplanes lobatus]GIE39853.1 hypothetical protein Alo02nite_27510 [Actinoplanes lobatus]